MAPLRTLLLGADAQRDPLRPALKDPQLTDLVGEAPTLAEGVGAAIALRPDLVVIAYMGDLDATIRGVDGILAANPLASLILVGASLDARELGLAMQAGIREVVPDAAGLKEAVQRSHVFLSRMRGARTASEPGRPKVGKLIVVHSPKGGAGKSTLSANLALTLAQDAAGDAALVDLSPQFGEVDLLFNLKPQAHFSDLARLGGQIDPETVSQALMAHASGLQVLASAPTPEDGELIDRTAVEGVLGALKGRFAFTVVDTAPILSEPIVRAMELADRIVLPFFPDLASLRHVQQSLKLWLELGIDLDKVELVGWSQKSEVDAEAIARVLRRPLTQQLPYVPDEALAAVNAGTPMVALSPKGAFAKAMKTFAARYQDKPQTALVEVKPASKLSELFARIRRMIDVPTQPT
ncbi:Septum site-determining protein MinD [compost metagenome]